jgi:hypothetical protein
MLELLKENNLLDVAISGRLPPHVLKAAKVAAVSEFSGVRNENGDGLVCTPEEHAEAERELDEYLKHYKLDKSLREAVRMTPHRTFRKGAQYAVKRGYFKGRAATYRGTDQDVWGCGWLDNPGNPACEKYIFRAQHDKLSINAPALVFSLRGENRDVILQPQEIGLEVS